MKINNNSHYSRKIVPLEIDLSNREEDDDEVTINLRNIDSEKFYTSKL
jgi:hypothetical protein